METEQHPFQKMTNVHTPDPKWVPLTREQVAALPDRTPVRVEWNDTALEGLLHREGTDDSHLCLRYGNGRYQWTGRLVLVATLHVHPEDVPADPDADRIERMAKAIHDLGCDCGELCEDDSPEAYRAMARAALAAYREEKA